MKVLCGVWEADPARRALATTADRAASAGDDLTVGVVAADGGTPGETFVDEVGDAVASAGVDPDVRVLSGDPGTRLVELAEGERFDRLVVGGGAKSPMGKIEIDPIVQSVLLNCHVTVTVVREP